MRSDFDLNTFEAAMTGLNIARQIVLGEEPTLGNGWTIGSEQDCNFCNEWQVANMVGLGHEDEDVLAATRNAAFALNLSGNLPFNVNAREFVFVIRPQDD